MPAPGQTIGDYRVLDKLGAGGMATVFRVEHTSLETLHALKVLAPEYRANEEARLRFLEEARIQAKYLDHPGIVKVTGIVATDDVAGLVMELVEGESLADYIAREGTSSAEQIRAIMLPILHAIAHAHDNGIIHRDLKPANVLLARAGGRLIPKLTDFGIAKVGDRLAKKLTTQIAARMGTLGYMSPEQIRHAKQVTLRSDVFSLGAVLYELATGHEAFPGDNEYDVMDAVVHSRYRAPRDWVADLDPAIDAVIRTALASDPDARFADARAMSAALMPAGASAPVPDAVALPPASQATRWLSIAVLVGVLGLAAAGAGLYFALRPSAPAVSDDVLRQLSGTSDDSDSSAQPPRGTDPRLARLSVRDAPSQGGDDSLLTVIFVVDYDHIGSRQLQAILQRLLRDFRDEVRLVIKWRTTTDMGRRAAQTAVRAADREHVWSYHDKLLAIDPDVRLTEDHLQDAWTDAGLSLFELLTVGEHRAADARVERGNRELALASVKIAPSLVVNGEVVAGVQTYDTYLELFKRQLAEARAQIASGVPRDQLYQRLMRAAP